MNDWFKEWFKSDYYLEVYRHRDDRDAVKLINLLLGHIPHRKGTKFLDAACGSGRHASILASKGFDVTGFDLSQPLLKIAARKRNESGLKFNLVNGDMRYICFRGYFDVILNLFTSFGYFGTDDENFAFIKNSASFLKPGGYFLFDYFNGGKLIDRLEPLTEKEAGELRITEKRRYEEGRIKKEIVISDSEREFKFSESVKVYSLDEILKNFGKFGFEKKSVFGDYDGGSFDLSFSDRMIILFVK